VWWSGPSPSLAVGKRGVGCARECEDRIVWCPQDNAVHNSTPGCGRQVNIRGSRRRSERCFLAAGLFSLDSKCLLASLRTRCLANVCHFPPTQPPQARHGRASQQATKTAWLFVPALLASLGATKRPHHHLKAHPLSQYNTCGLFYHAPVAPQTTPPHVSSQSQPPHVQDEAPVGLGLLALSVGCVSGRPCCRRP
jgi:hypothetical protein